MDDFPKTQPESLKISTFVKLHVMKSVPNQSNPLDTINANAFQKITDSGPPAKEQGLSESWTR